MHALAGLTLFGITVCTEATLTRPVLEIIIYVDDDWQSEMLQKELTRSWASYARDPLSAQFCRDRDREIWEIRQYATIEFVDRYDQRFEYCECYPAWRTRYSRELQWLPDRAFSRSGWALGYMRYIVLEWQDPFRFQTANRTKWLWQQNRIDFAHMAPYVTYHKDMATYYATLPPWTEPEKLISGIKKRYRLIHAVQDAFGFEPCRRTMNEAIDRVKPDMNTPVYLN